MEPLPLARQEPGDAGRVVGRFDELDLGLADGEEGDPDPVLRDVHHVLERQAEHVAPEPRGTVDRPHDQRDVVDLADAPDRVRNAPRRGVRIERLHQTVISSRWTPNAVRSRSLISPTVAWAFTASIIGGRRLSCPRAATSSRSRAAAHAAGSRSARTRRTRSTWRRSPSGSIRCSGAAACPASSSRNRFTPTTTRSPRSTACWTRYADSWIWRCWKPPSIAASVPPIE